MISFVYIIISNRNQIKFGMFISNDLFLYVINSNSIQIQFGMFISMILIPFLVWIIIRI